MAPGRIRIVVSHPRCQTCRAALQTAANIGGVVSRADDGHLTYKTLMLPATHPECSGIWHQATPEMFRLAQDVWNGEVDREFPASCPFCHESWKNPGVA